MKSKSPTPRARIFHKSRSRRREEADGCGLSPNPPPHVRSYLMTAGYSGSEVSRRIVLRLALLGAFLSTQF